MLDRITAALAALALAGAAQAQDGESVYVNVDGAAIGTTAALAAEACGMDEAAVRAAAEGVSGAAPADGMAADAAGDDAMTTGNAAVATTEGAASESDGTASTDEPATDDEVAMAQGVEDPSTTEPANSDADLLALAVCEVDVETAASLGIPTTAEIVTE